MLQAQPHVKELLRTPTSFGGIRERGVRDALKAAYAAVQSGAKYYLRSDISEFFRNIPRGTAVSMLLDPLDDDDFCDLVERAVETELENLSSLGANAALFPIHEVGVAQGCCLSPLIGNTLLADFDETMNGRGITCLRYIDDFIVLGPSPKKVRAAFRSAQSILRSFGLSAYDPSSSGKAADGPTSDSFEFLGCEVRPGHIRPTKKARSKILERIREILDSSVAAMEDPKACAKDRRSYVQTLAHVSNTLEGWGNQYSFCNDPEFMGGVDARVNKLLKEYTTRYQSRKKKASRTDPSMDDARRLLGVHLLADCYKRPIVGE